MNMLLLFLLLSGLKSFDCANILALFPLPLYSHTNAFMPVFKELVARGHNLTMVSPFPQKKPLANWTDLVTDKKRMEKYYDETVRSFHDANKYNVYPKFFEFCAGVMEIAFNDKILQRLIKDDNLNFDLLIMEPLFAHESLLAFGHKLNIPVIGVHPLPLTAWANYIINNELPPSYSPNCRTPYTDSMNFLQRLDNAIVNMIELLTGLYYYFPIQERLMEKYMVYSGSQNRPSLIKLMRNVSLYLVDAHLSTGYAEPHHPHVVPVGGISLKSSDSLPSDLQKYMDSSIKGVVYLSFGSNIAVSAIDSKLVDAILSTFKNLEFNVLMKWENDTLQNKPNNVEIRKWFPQTSILAHPKCRLFITHGGLHGMSEAIYFGVPIVGVPFFADQEFNMRFAEKEGFGRTILRKDITAEAFQHVIESVLYNKSYKENALRRSLISRDRPNSAIDTAIYWIEYVLRHKDVSFLHPASTNLSIYQLYQLDVLMVFVLAILTPIILSYVLYKVISKCFSKSKPYNKRKKE